MLHRNTTSEELFNVLSRLMSLPELSDFRLVGGTALSLLRGHRESVDIDMFCDGPYGEINYKSTGKARLRLLAFKAGTIHVKIICTGWQIEEYSDKAPQPARSHS